MDLMKLNIQLFADGKVVIDTELNTKDFEQGLNRMQNTSEKAGNTIKSIVAGLGITKIISKGMQVISSSIDDAVKRSDTLNNFSKVMSNLGVSAKESDKSIKLMSDKLAGLPTTLDQGAMAVQRFTSKNSDVKKSTDLFLALNNALLAGGASSEIQASALEQLSQSYAKGKPDMMEWRTAMTAMPAQLKQVAIAMGYIDADALGEALRDGTVSMDDFMDTVVKLNKEGVKGFQSFEKQARNATGGIGTAVTVAKTQVVKGLTDIIDGLNKGLKKSGTSISKIFADLGKGAKQALDKVANALSKVDFKGLFNILGKLVPIIGSVVAGFLAYGAALKVISAFNLAKNIITATTALLGLTNATNLSAGAMKIFNVVMSANPIGLVIGAVTALTTAFVIFGNQQSEAQKSVQKTNETLKQYENEMKQVEKAKDESLSKSMNEIAYYQSLNNELKGITDENGKVQDGYEDRASFIVGELSKAFGVEMSLQDGIITNYQSIQTEIDNTIAKKKAMAYVNAHEEEYNKTLKEEGTLHNEVTKNAGKRQEALEKMNVAIDDEIKKNKDVKKYREEIYKYLQGEVKWLDLSIEARGAYNSISNENIEILNKERENYIEYDKALEKANKSYAKNQETMDKYRQAQEQIALAEKAAAEGHMEEANAHYAAVQKIFLDTVEFNGKTKAANDKKFEEGKAGWEAYRQFLLENQDNYSQEYLDREQARIDEGIKKLDDERNKANEQLKQKNKDLVNTTITGINDQLAAITGSKYEFRDAGNGNVELFIGGFGSGIVTARNTAAELTTGMINLINSKEIDAEKAGSFLMAGLGKGMNNNRRNPEDIAAGIAGNIISTLNTIFDINSPSKVTEQMGKYLDEGLAIGINKEKRSVLKDVESFSNEIIDKMNNAVGIETSKLTSSIQTSGTYQVAMSSTPTFNLRDNSTNRTELVVDGRKLAEVINTQNRNREVAKA